MPFSHHSHSGEFCGHAQDKLEDILQVAIGKKMDLYAMTEHMPRGEQDLYPEEVRQPPLLKFLHCVLFTPQDCQKKFHQLKFAQVKAGITPVALDDLFKAYYTEACRLRDTYSDKIALLVGMEIDWLRPSSKVEIQDLLSTYPLDLFIGSVHHVHGIPTDYSRDLYLEARAKSGGTEERILEDYFDLQLEMLKSMKPPIVGHFDVIRLWSDDPNGSFTEWPTVWHKIQRNLDIIKEYGGVLELNSAALRKGMREPYPNGEICKVCQITSP